MIFYYSGAANKGSAQTNPNLSLGGNIGSPISNATLNNIFSEASMLSIQQNKRETKMIILKNDDSVQTASSMFLDFLVNKGCIANYQIAVVLPNAQGCFEQILSSDALPFNATFQPLIVGHINESIDSSPVNLPSLGPGKTLGIWLVRTYNFSSSDLKTKDKAYWQSLVPPTPNPPVNNPAPIVIPPVDLQDELDIQLNFTLS